MPRLTAWHAGAPRGKRRAGAQWRVESEEWRLTHRDHRGGRFAQELPCFAMLRTAQRQDMFAYSNRFLDSASSKVASLFSLLPSAFFLLFSPLLQLGDTPNPVFGDPPSGVAGRNVGAPF